MSDTDTVLETGTSVKITGGAHSGQKGVIVSSTVYGGSYRYYEIMRKDPRKGNMTVSETLVQETEDE